MADEEAQNQQEQQQRKSVTLRTPEENAGVDLAYCLPLHKIFGGVLPCIIAQSTVKGSLSEIAKINKGDALVNVDNTEIANNYPPLNVLANSDPESLNDEHDNTSCVLGNGEFKNPGIGKQDAFDAVIERIKNHRPITLLFEKREHLNTNPLFRLITIYFEHKLNTEESANYLHIHLKTNEIEFCKEMILLRKQDCEFPPDWKVNESDFDAQDENKTRRLLANILLRPPNFFDELCNSVDQNDEAKHSTIEDLVSEFLQTKIQTNDDGDNDDDDDTTTVGLTTMESTTSNEENNNGNLEKKKSVEEDGEGGS